MQLTTSQTGLDGTLVSLTRDGTYIGQGVLASGSTVVRTDVSLQSLNGVVALLDHDDFEPGTLTLGPLPPISSLG